MQTARHGDLEGEIQTIISKIKHLDRHSGIILSRFNVQYD